jgi:DNA repair exonuclease SbcCD ATPase subunit
VKRDLELVLDSSTLINTDVSADKLTMLESKTTTLQQNLSVMNEKSFANRTLISQYTSDQQQIEELEARSSDINNRLEDLPIYEMLTEAYSNRGLKRIVVQNISKRIQDNLNKYSGLLNSEKVEYEFQVNPTTIDIVAHRQTGVSDVCELSGAESRVFNFLMPLSIMSMIPEKQRLNMMIMDEPMTNLDEGLKDMFINNFVPSLQTIVPSIFIMEPTAVKYQANRTLTAVRKNGTTTLQEKENKHGY